MLIVIFIASEVYSFNAKFFSYYMICTCWQRYSLGAQKSMDQLCELPVCSGTKEPEIEKKKQNSAVNDDEARTCLYIFIPSIKVILQ